MTSNQLLWYTPFINDTPYPLMGSLTWYAPYPLIIMDLHTRFNPDG